MSLEKDIIQLLKQYRDEECGGKALKASESLGVTPATFSRWLTGASIPKVESLIIPFERLNAKITINANSSNQYQACLECKELKKKLEMQERELTRELLNSKEKIIQLQEELLELQKNKEQEQPEEDKEDKKFSECSLNGLS